MHALAQHGPVSHTDAGPGAGRPERKRAPARPRSCKRAYGVAGRARWFWLGLYQGGRRAARTGASSSASGAYARAARAASARAAAAAAASSTSRSRACRRPRHAVCGCSRAASLPPKS
jgi:hypothetical protein